MTKNEDDIKDWRSTGRRKARRSLFQSHVKFCCIECGKTTTEPPKDAPAWFDELWPEELRILTPMALQADHETKDVTNNDEAYLNWRCASCHKLRDMQTEKGISTVTESYWS